jgi:hypothetical protein
MFFLSQNEITILISGLLPDLGFGGTCFILLWLIASLEGEVFHLRVVIMVNCLSTQLQPQWVISN